MSDPGITLIELFAWLTEILAYRINRIPDRLHLALLELVGVRPAASQQARVDLRFILDAPTGGRIPAGTEVASPRTADGELIVFQTDADLEIPVGRLAGYAIERSGQMSRVNVTDGVAVPPGETQAPFGAPPAVDDAVLLGFEVPIAGLTLAVHFETAPAEARDPDAADRLLVWESPGLDGTWYPASVVSDETGGFLLGGGTVIVEAPAEASSAKLSDVPLHWLRCRVVPREGKRRGTNYTRSPEISSVSAAIIGATVGANHAEAVEAELLAPSEGIPGTAYRLAHHPVLTPRPWRDARGAGAGQRRMGGVATR